MNSTDEYCFKDYFDTIDDFLFVLDLNGIIIHINNSVTSLLGYADEALTGKSILLVYPPEYKAKAQASVNEMIAGRRSVSQLPLISSDNKYIPVETRASRGRWNSEPAVICVSRNQSAIILCEGKFQEVFNHSQMLMAISEITTGALIQVNQPFLLALGYSEPEIIGKSLKDLAIFYDTEQGKELIRNSENNETICNKEIVLQSKTGELLHCLFSIKKIEIHSHHYQLLSANNVTELKTAGIRLKHNLKQQTLLADISQNLNSINNITQKFDETLKMLGDHTQVSRVYIFEDDAGGYSTSNTYEWCNKGINPQKEELQLVPYDLIPSWKKILKEQGMVFSTCIDELPEDLVQILAPQAIKSILVLPLYVEGEFMGFIGFDECTVNRRWEHDETELLRTIANIISQTFERIKFQKQLSESAAQLKMAIENTETGLWDWNIATGEVYFNDIWCRMIGFEKTEIEPHVSSWEKLVHPDDMPGIKESINKHFAGETSIYETTHRLLTKSGEWKWVMDKGKVTERNENGNPIRAIGTHTDIDHQKNIENELQIANTTKDKFFAIVGHDLRESIGTMMQVADLIAEKGNVNEQTQDILLRSQKELSKSTYQLLENLLHWARYNRNQIEYSPKNINIRDIVKHSIDNIKVQAEKKGISLTYNIHGPSIVYADEDMVKLILRNLVSNALKFTRNEGFIQIDIQEQVDFVKILITDNGIGISENDIRKIFSDNHFHTTFGTDFEKGSGLGLKLCRNFIEVNKGILSVESEIGKGTTFSFTLPEATKKRC